uniref:Uncharacterized protein n=1 Tax=Phlebotomus papatasi TaxID=29031 RepID=A0A1B0DJE2_PHLPP
MKWYRAPGFTRPNSISKKTLSAPGLQHQPVPSMYQRRDGRRKNCKSFRFCKSHDLLLGESRPLHHQSSSGVSDTAAEEKEASDYERFSWRGSFESALLANGDSRTKLTLLDHSSSATALAAKRRSAGDLLFNQKSLSREQLDRVRSCGSIGGGMDHEIENSKLWGSSTSQKSARRRSSVPDAACDSDNDSSDDERRFATRSTLPRSLQTTTSSSTNSLPRLSTSNLPGSSSSKQHSVYHFLQNNVKSAIHTIVEESCEDSEVEQSSMKNKYRVSASDLEKYFFYGLGDGKPSASVENREDSLSESSSICSEGMDSLGGPDDQGVEPNPVADLTASRLEKYFLTGFMGFSAENADSDGSGSVGSDSEGRPSPEQRRKKLVRARGSGRSHSSSLDNLLAKEDSIPDQQVINDTNDSNDSSETDTCDENTLTLDKSDGQSDTMKRKKQGKKRLEHADDNKEDTDLSDEEGRKTPQPEFLLPPNNLVQSRKQHSRDSGFVGSNDDLLKTDDSLKSSELKVELEEIEEENRSEIKETETQESATKSIPPSVTLTRKDSFNNWSSDEETNVMMSKMRQFFKTLVAASANAQSMSQSSKAAPTTPLADLSGESLKSGTPVAKPRNRSKPPQLVYFESELTRLMKTVPGINDDQVREIVEYLSSEDTWSDSYDSSDYTSSDLEGPGKKPKKSELQEQISASCQQIINKFDNIVDHDEEGDRGDGGLLIGETNESPGLNRETAFVYQKLVASFSKIAAGEEKPATSTGSPPIFAKVIHHIGSRLVALMHEVSSGESHTSSSPRGAAASRHHRRLQAKISATTTEDDDSTSDSAMEKPEKITFAHLPRRVKSIAVRLYPRSSSSRSIVDDSVISSPESISESVAVFPPNSSSSLLLISSTQESSSARPSSRLITADSVFAPVTTVTSSLPLSALLPLTLALIFSSLSQHLSCTSRVSSLEFTIFTGRRRGTSGKTSSPSACIKYPAKVLSLHTSSSWEFVWCTITSSESDTM